MLGVHSHGFVRLHLHRGASVMVQAGGGGVFPAATEEQVGDLPEGTRWGLNSLCVRTLPVIFNLLKAALVDYFNLILPE